MDQALSSSTLILAAPLFSKNSNITLDCNGATIKPLKPNTNGLGFGAAHDIIVKNCRFRGHFAGSNPSWVPQQNSGNGYLDGDVPALPCKSWDTVCEAMSPALRRAAVKVIFDQCTWDGIQDDGLSIWGGGRRISFTRNFALRSFHLSTTGWKGTLTDRALMRLWISWHYNVATKIGERNFIYPREGTHWWFFDRNFIEGWTWYQYKDFQTGKPAWNSPYGVRLSGQAPNENNMGWGRANCALGTPLGMPDGAASSIPPNPTPHLTWGLTVDNGGCDNAQTCAPNCDKWSGADIPKCNPRVARTISTSPATRAKRTTGRASTRRATAATGPLPARPDASLVARAGRGRRAEAVAHSRRVGGAAAPGRPCRRVQGPRAAASEPLSKPPHRL